MSLRGAILALSFTPVCLLAVTANASTTDMLIGLDQKVTYGANGPVNGPPGKDAVLVVDIANPAKPRIRASLPITMERRRTGFPSENAMIRRT